MTFTENVKKLYATKNEFQDFEKSLRELRREYESIGQEINSHGSVSSLTLDKYLESKNKYDIQNGLMAEKNQEIENLTREIEKSVADFPGRKFSIQIGDKNRSYFEVTNNSGAVTVDGPYSRL